MAAALINVPAKAKRGDIIEIKTLMSYIMETGYRHTASGEVVPRDIITSFACRYNGEFEWIGDNGFSETATASITVE